MTEKRYFAHKHLLQENKVHDNICHNFMSLDETVEHMNNEYWKYKQLKEENKQLKQIVGFLKNDNAKDIVEVLNLQQTEIWKVKRENEQLKQEISQLKHWNKCLAEKRHQEISYKPYTTSKSEKELKEFLEQKMFNCSDR